MDMKQNKKVFIIAEAGVNHNGSLKLARKLIDAAKASGADAIKFQTFKTKEFITHTEKTQFAMLKKLELSKGEFKELFNYCRKKKIMFLSTAFDYQSAEFLNRLGVPYFKISSGDLTNIPFLAKIAQYKKPIILSTGMSSLQEVKKAVKAIYAKRNRSLILLHCTSNYPAKYKHVNLRAMDTLRKALNLPVGYSDHTLGIEIPIAAVALGATLIEKHFTIDKNMAGPDQAVSLNPDEFKAMVSAIRNIEKAFGDGIKKASPSELKSKRFARKSIVAAREIKRREILTEENVTVKRPGVGISPALWGAVIGKIAKRNFKEDEIIEV